MYVCKRKVKVIKYILCVGVVSVMTCCNLEGAVKNASERCEDEIAKIIQSVESTCLTKDELLEIIESVRAKNDQKDDSSRVDQ
jgi:hypothetical protein